MVNFEFYRCHACKRPIEVTKLIKDHKCMCGSRKVVPTYLSFTQLWWYILTHPECVIAILRGKK